MDEQLLMGAPMPHQGRKKPYLIRCPYTVGHGVVSCFMSKTCKRLGVNECFFRECYLHYLCLTCLEVLDIRDLNNFQANDCPWSSCSFCGFGFKFLPLNSELGNGDDI